MHEHLLLLRREFDADQGTFLLGLRGAGIERDKAAFSRFERAMRWACEQFQGADQLDRWIAEGLYYTSWFVRDWTSHPNFPRADPEKHYNDCIQRISDLADWVFHGSHSASSLTTGRTCSRLDRGSAPSRPDAVSAATSVAAPEGPPRLVP